jgi:assimilatory nitrate reductase catalytic subunit
MTRTGLAAQLCRHIPEPIVEVHPDDAEHYGVTEGALTCVDTARGESVVLARISDRQRRGSVFMPMHWTDAFAPNGRANAATSGKVDPESGQPEFKHTPARIYGYRETWRGFALLREPIPAPDLPVIWRRIPQAGAQLFEFAGRGDAKERDAVRRAITGSARGEHLRFEDIATGVLREAFVEGDRLDRVLYIGARMPPRDWLAGLFNEPVTDETRKWLLHGRSPAAGPDNGEIVCACAVVGRRVIEKAIAKGAATIEALGAETRAGVTCGSCRPELRRMLQAQFGERQAALTG